MGFEGNSKFSTSFLGLYFWFVLPVLLIKITEAFNSEAYHVMLYVEQGTRINLPQCVVYKRRKQ